ncbi:MAG: DUF4199 domain-containing protein [Prevotella sp.]|jgi:ABC-type amino acid transport system permease subunit
MINIVALVQLKAFARVDALALAGLWIASFVAVVAMPGASVGGLLAMITPLMLYWLLRRFRDKVLDGYISFRRGLAYTWYTSFYACLLFAVVQYVYFQFLDNGTFLANIETSLKEAAPAYREMGMSVAQLEEAVRTVGLMPPVQLVFAFMMQNLFACCLMSFPLALVAVRRNNKESE